MSGLSPGPQVQVRARHTREMSKHSGCKREGAGTEAAGPLRGVRVKEGAGLRGWARPHLVYVTPAQLLHFLKVDLGLSLALLAHPPLTTLPVETETAAEDEEA